MLFVVGGANGAGKSTFAKQFVEDLSIPYLCADEIAFELAGDRYAEVAAKAGRNDGDQAKLVATYQHEEDTIRDEDRFRRFREVLETAIR